MSGPALALRRRWTPIRRKRRPGVPLIGPLAPPVRAFHPQPAGTAPGDDDGGGMSFAMRTRLYAASVNARIKLTHYRRDGVDPSRYLGQPSVSGCSCRLLPPMADAAGDAS